MTKLESPSMALNDVRLHVTIQMWNTRKVAAEDDPYTLISEVKNVAMGTPEKRLKHLVINCHGAPGYLQLGQGIDRPMLGMFKQLSGCVDRIWIRACKVARITNPGSETTGDGNLFCSDMAKYAKCEVVASSATQTTADNAILPVGMIDRYEGTTFVYGPGGNVIAWNQNLSGYWYD